MTWVYCGNTLCVRRKVLNYDCGLLSLIRINIVWPEFWWNTPQYKDTWILSISSMAYDIWSIFCHASQHSEMMKCLKILCVFFWVTTWHIWELCYITKPQRIIVSIGFVINQFYQRWLFVSLQSLCQILQDWKQRRLADDCVHKISFWSQNVVTRQWRKPIKEELTTYLNFPDHTGWEARRRTRRDRDKMEEERRVILRRRSGTRGCHLGSPARRGHSSNINNKNLK